MHFHHSSGHPLNHKVLVRPANSARLPNFAMPLGRLLRRFREEMTFNMISGKLRWYSGRCLLFGCILAYFGIDTAGWNCEWFFNTHHVGIISTFLIILRGTMKDHHQWSIDFNTNHCIKTGMKLEYIWDNQSCVDWDSPGVLEMSFFWVK